MRAVDTTPAELVDEEERDPLAALHLISEVVALAGTAYCLWILCPEGVRIEIVARVASARRWLSARNRPTGVVSEAMRVLIEEESEQ
jgi:hypothetical protein